MRPVIFLLNLLALLVFASCGGETAPAPATPAAAAKMKVAFVYVGPVGDGGWTFAHDLARKDLEAQFPWVETTYLESVPEGAEAVRALTQLAQKGNKVIFTTSFGFMDPTVEVASRFPDTVFMHCSGYKRAANVGTYFGRMEQAEYLSGLIAGSLTKTGKLGYIAPHPIPEVVRHINGFTRGVRAVHPTATVHVVWTNAWFDPAREREAAVALSDAGADVLATGADSTAHLAVAEERGIYAMGYDSDAREVAPNAFLTAPIWDWTVVYRDVVQRVHDGTWTSTDLWAGLETGLVGLAPLSDKVPPAVVALVEDRAAQIKTGQLHIFAGPLRRQDGSVAYAEGQAPSDEEQLRWDWFVEGVVGDVPK